MQPNNESLRTPHSSSQRDSEASDDLFYSMHEVDELTTNLGMPSLVDDNFPSFRATLGNPTATLPRGTAPIEQIHALGIPSFEVTSQNIERLRHLGNEPDSEKQQLESEYTIYGQPPGQRIIVANQFWHGPKDKKERDWEAKKQDLEALYRKLPLSMVKSEMDKIGFHAS
jgi:hypothetical protein